MQFRLELAGEMDLSPNQVTAVTLKQIRRTTAEDFVLTALHVVVMDGWPSERKVVPEELRVY